VQFAIAAVYFHWILGNGGFSGSRSALMLAVAGLLFMARGSGPWSVDNLIFKKS